MIEVTGWAHGDNVFYTLLKDGVVVQPPRDGGFWAERDFAGSGRYTVQATRFSCTVMMTGYADVTYAAANIQEFNVSGGGLSCYSDQTFSIELSGSQLGVSYQLRNGQEEVNSILGTGGPISWNNISAPGTYTVFGWTDCAKPMIGTAEITVENQIPVQTVSYTGSTEVCFIQDNGSGGLLIGLPEWSYSDGIYYILLKDGVQILAPRDGAFWADRELLGTGRYTVKAINGACEVMMSGFVDVTFGAAIVQYNVKPFNPLAKQITLDGSEAGVNYQLKLGEAEIGSLKAGTGSSLTWDNITTPGIYSIYGFNSAGCSLKMIGDVSVFDINYITTSDFRSKGIKSVINATSNDKIETIEYFDGVGRLAQTVQRNASPSGADMIFPKWYDEFGREPVHFLPFAIQENNGGFRYDAVRFPDEYQGSLQQVFYQNTDKVAWDSKPLSKDIYESSPLNRIAFKGGVGTQWQPATIPQMTDKTIKFQYEMNLDEEVLLFKYNATNGQAYLADQLIGRFYPAGKLTVNITYDEHSNKQIEYTDLNQRVVCKKVESHQNGSKKVYASTYYVYDAKGNLMIVLPPEAIAQIEANNN